MSKVLISKFGRKFLIPAEYDIMLNFAPVRYSKNSEQVPKPEGKFRVRTKHQTEETAKEP